jgi:excisionase family DNA binding protein
MRNRKETTRREKQDGENTETKTGNLGKIDLNSKSEVLFSDSLNSSIRWLTTNEAAEYLRTSPRQIRNWVYQGRIKAYKLLGKSLRFKVSELDLLFKGGLVWG